MLYKFLQNERKKKSGLTVTYFVSGITKPDENGTQVLKCSVVPEEKLEVCKKSLAHLTSCHLYSVQKSKLKDSNALFITDYEKLKENVFESNKYSSIQCDRSVLRSQEELDLLSLNTVQTAEPDKKPANGMSKPANGVSASTKPAGKKQSKSAIASMFSKAETSKQKKEDEAKTKEKESKAPAKGGNKAKQGGMMANFFSKKTEIKAEPSSKPEPKPVEKKKSPEKKKDSPVGKSKKTSRKQDSDDEEVQTKSKRRRIKPDLFDSSSEEEEDPDETAPAGAVSSGSSLFTEMEDEDESPIPPTPPPKEPSPEPEQPVKEDSPEVEIVKTEEPKKTSPAKETSAKGNNSGERKRKRTKKHVQKTYMGKDGYMVTEKVWESDSTDASEAEEPVKKAPKELAKPTAQSKGKKSPQKKPSPGKKGAGSGKQTSLTSFFRKS